MKRVNETYLIFAVFSFLTGLMLAGIFTPNYYSSDAPAQVEIKRGQNVSEITETLVRAEIVPSRTVFRTLVFLTGTDSKLKAGKYSFENGLSYFDVIEMLEKGVQEEQISVTIPEGIWQHELASLLQKKMGIDSTRFMNLSEDKVFLKSLGINSSTLEGYLLPETYYFNKNATAIDVIARMKREMDKLFDEEAKKRMAGLELKREEILALASIIDAETNIESEFKRISGVYHNRLKKDMLLQACPTVQYLKRYRKHNKIYFKDLEIDSPINTYMYPGLPPHPINNPGRAAIKAALFPEEHRYYYFVANGTGGHTFSKSLAEHNRNVGKYRKWRRIHN